MHTRGIMHATHRLFFPLVPCRRSSTILVVSEGFASCSALCHLITNGDSAHVVLIDEKPFFEFTPSTSRSITYPGRTRHINFNQNSGPGIIFLQGHVTFRTYREATVSRHDDVRVTFFCCALRLLYLGNRC